MTQKQKEIKAMMPLIHGKHVKVFYTNPYTKNISFFIEGTASKFTGIYLILTNAKIWNDEKKDQYMVHTGRIGKIEVDNEKSPI